MQEYITLPDKYQSLIREKLPPKPGQGCSGRPFWTSTESYDLYYIKDKFQFRREKYVPLELGEKGFFCVGCESGSGPQPFIVVHIDDQKIGLISPYVYVVNQTEDYVDLKVGGDMSNYDEYNFDDYHAVENPSNQYKIHYYNQKDIIGSRWLSVCVGSFGNYDLPQLNGIPKYEFLT